MQRPNPTNGLRHVALFIQNYDECRHFYVDLIGMQIDWEPDSDNLYLTTGFDNFALHRAKPEFNRGSNQALDHIGFFLNKEEDVENWYNYMLKNNVKIMAKPKNHRDGTKSFYCADPDGNIVQMIYYPRVK